MDGLLFGAWTQKMDGYAFSGSLGAKDHPLEMARPSLTIAQLPECSCFRRQPCFGGLNGKPKRRTGAIFRVQPKTKVQGNQWENHPFCGSKI